MKSENLNEWLLRIVREDEQKGLMSGWIEEKRFMLLPPMAMLLEHILQGGSVIVLTDKRLEWFGKYITSHINQPHKGRPFFPLVEINNLGMMIDANAQDGVRGFKSIADMLGMLAPNHKFLYIGKKSARLEFALMGSGWYWVFDTDEFLASTDEQLDFKLLELFRLFERAIVDAMLGKVTLSI